MFTLLNDPIFTPINMWSGALPRLSLYPLFSLVSPILPLPSYSSPTLPTFPNFLRLCMSFTPVIYNIHTKVPKMISSCAPQMLLQSWLYQGSPHMIILTISQDNKYALIPHTNKFNHISFRPLNLILIAGHDDSYLPVSDSRSGTNLSPMPVARFDILGALPCQDAIAITPDVTEF